MPTHNLASGNLPETAAEFISRRCREYEKELQRNKTKKMKDIGRRGYHYYLRTHWTFMKQHNNPEKVFIIERLELAEVEGKTVSQTTKDIGNVEYRICYFIVGKNGNRKGKWTWGQFCPMIPSSDLRKLLKAAKSNGTILDRDWPNLT